MFLSIPPVRLVGLYVLRALSRYLGDSGVRRAGGASADVTVFVSEDARESFGDVRVAMVAVWHAFSRRQRRRHPVLGGEHLKILSKFSPKFRNAKEMFS
nr:hypothetical protein [Haladaptatus salinisoli]